jgi:hypothetical protein
MEPGFSKGRTDGTSDYGTIQRSPVTNRPQLTIPNPKATSPMTRLRIRTYLADLAPAYLAISKDLDLAPLPKVDIA